jgi:hypothetical protein
MSPTNKKPTEAGGVRRQNIHAVVQPRNVAHAPRVARPAAPPAYRPRPPKSVAQPKTAVTRIQTVAPARSVAPPVFRPRPQTAAPRPQPSQRVVAPLNTRTAIQRSRGASGGKAGLGYTSMGDAYSQDDIQQAITDAKLKKPPKGHNKGNKNSGVSGQTTKENAIVADQLRKNKEKKHTQEAGCRQFHNKRNSGKRCKFCQQLVD